MATNVQEQTPEVQPEQTPDEGELLLVRYPSVASNVVCRALGVLYELFPVPKVGGVKLSHLLFPLPTSPIPAVVYFWLKVFGDKYVLTTKMLQRRKALTGRLVKQVPLEDVADVQVSQSRGQVFYRAGDLTVLGPDGQVLLKLEGVPRPDIFRHNILEARDSLRHVQQALQTIRSRRKPEEQAAAQTSKT